MPCGQISTTSIECCESLFGDFVQNNTSGHQTIFHFRPIETSRENYIWRFLLYSAVVKLCPHAKTYQVAMRLRNRCNRSMCLVNISHAYLSLITSLSFFHPLNILSLGSSYHS